MRSNKEGLIFFSYINGFIIFISDMMEPRYNSSDDWTDALKVSFYWLLYSQCSLQVIKFRCYLIG